MKKNIILLGASSELAIKFTELNYQHNIYKVTSKNIDDNNSNTLVISNYIKNSDEIVSFIQGVEKPIIIFFNGYLKEDRPRVKPNFVEISNTLNANFYVPYLITSKLIQKNIKIKKFIFISSFAATKARYKNFTYAYSKKLLEDSIKALNINNYLIIRFGKINTTMSEGHKKSIFDLTKHQAANFISLHLDKKFGTIYSSNFLYLLSRIFIIVPNSILKRLDI